MTESEDILELVGEKRDEAGRDSRRGVIIQPGAIGDCILTLRLAGFMKKTLGLGGIDILGHSDYISIFPERTCVDAVRSIETVELHRLFSDKDEFELTDGDPLIDVFADYAWVVSFMGEADSDFEKNLIFTVNCSRSAEVIILSLKPTDKTAGHIADYYVDQFAEQCDVEIEAGETQGEAGLIKATKADMHKGLEILREAGFEGGEKVAVIAAGSGGREKCWRLENFLEVAKGLDNEGIQTVFLFGPAEVERFGDADVKAIEDVGRRVGDLSLSEVVGLLSQVQCFVGNDSGITHLSAAMGVSTAAVFGPTDPKVYGPVGPDALVFKSDNKAFASEADAELQQRVLESLLK